MGFCSWFKCVLLFSVCCCVSDVGAINPFAALKTMVTNIFSSKSEESCDAKWIDNNIAGLRDSLENRLHGQHVVNDVLLGSIKAHVRNPDPVKSLVLSLHGWTGSGKTFVSHMVVDNLYKKGMNSKYVHLFVGTLHFPHQSELEIYKDQLRTWIKGNVSECERQLFVFDEIDKLPLGLLDAIKPFLDTRRQIDGVDYRKSLFLLIGNTGGNDISKHTLEHWRHGKDRTHITLSEMEEIIQLAAFNEQGGLWQSLLLKHDLISAFVPFLPLEKRHIKLCIKDDIKHKKLTLTDDNISLVVDQLQYMPPEEKLFSKSGCKRVSQKVDQLIED